MPSLRELRRKVKSVKSTQQITKAMKMVSAARLRRAQGRIVSARPFAVKMSDMLSDLLLQVADVNQDRQLSAEEIENAHPLLRRKTTGPHGLVLITSDRGLCGSFNTTLIKKGLEFMHAHTDAPIVLFPVGRKGRDFFRRAGAQIQSEYVNIFNRLSYTHAELIGQDVMEFFAKGGRDVTMIYSEFKSAIVQKPQIVPLLPLTPPVMDAAKAQAPASPFIYEPRQPELLEALFPRYVKGQIFRALLESFASEMGARMSAMENASRNGAHTIHLRQHPLA